MKQSHPTSRFLLGIFVGLLVLPAFTVSTPSEFDQEVTSLYASGAGALAPSNDPYIEDRTETITEIQNFPQIFLDGLIPCFRNGVVAYRRLIVFSNVRRPRRTIRGRE